MQAQGLSKDAAEFCTGAIIRGAGVTSILDKNKNKNQERNQRRHSSQSNLVLQDT